MTALLWLSVIAGYAWSVWCLDRLWRRPVADHDDGVAGAPRMRMAVRTVSLIPAA